MEKLKSGDWIENDNPIAQELVGNGTVYLKVESIGCWKISEFAENDTVNLVLYYFIMYSISL